MRVAYQGEKFSNSENAAQQLVAILDMKGAQLVPCRTSARVVEALVKGDAEYGVLAIQNSTFGDVAETKKALEGLDFIECASRKLPIHHALFSKSEEISSRKLTHIYSHPQALGQCQATLSKIAPKAIPVDSADTAFSAQQLSEGFFSETSGVLCKKEAGDAFGLHLLKEKVEDAPDNMTTFVLVKKRPSSVLPNVAYKDRLFRLFCKPAFVQWSVTGLLTCVIFLTLFLNAKLGWTAGTIATSIVGTFAAIILNLTSPKFLQYAQQRRVVGYWKYNPIPKKPDAPAEENHHVARVVHIDSMNGKLRLRGWQAGDREQHRWESIVTLFRHTDDASGQLVYEYRDAIGHEQRTLVGIASLYWNTSDPAQLITIMSGLYYGHGPTKDDGKLTFERITFEEFERQRFTESRDSE